MTQAKKQAKMKTENALRWLKKPICSGVEAGEGLAISFVNATPSKIGNGWGRRGVIRYRCTMGGVWFRPERKRCRIWEDPLTE